MWWARPTAALTRSRIAPPDPGFSARLANFAAAAGQRAAACGVAYEDGFEWPPARGGAKLPYELQPGTGRRGPEELWKRFDEAVEELDQVSEGRSLRAVGRPTPSLLMSPRSLPRRSSGRIAPAACFRVWRNRGGTAPPRLLPMAERKFGRRVPAIASS